MTTTIEPTKTDVTTINLDSPDEVQRAMRTVLGNFCTGVAVITANIDGTPVGMTVQTLMSVSIDPPLVLFSPMKSSRTWKLIEQGGHFCANILSREHRDLGLRFTKLPPEERFNGVACATGLTGAPVLEDAIAFVECEIESVQEAGDHYLVLGRVQNLGEHEPGEPLLFFKGAFGSFVNMPRA